MAGHLRKRILEARRTGIRGRGRWLRLCHGPDGEGGLVLSVRRKFGKAVFRNRIRRQVRALCRELADDSWGSRLILITLDDQAAGVPYSALRKDLVRALKGAGLSFREPAPGPSGQLK